jgi:hypothetical protein
MIFAAAMSIPLLLSVIAIVISLCSVYYTRRQAKLVEKQEARKLLEEQSTEDWEKAFDEAVGALLKIYPAWIPGASGSTNAYGVIFSDVALRQRLETYLIDVRRSSIHPDRRQVSPELLLSPTVQHTIHEVLECVKKFKEARIEDAMRLGL